MSRRRTCDVVGVWGSVAANKATRAADVDGVIWVYILQQVLLDIPEDFLPLKWTRVVFLHWAIEVLTPLLYRLLRLDLKRAQSARKTP